MNAKRWCVGWLLAVTALLASGEDLRPKPAAGPVDASVVRQGDILPPRTMPSCRSGACPFAGQTVTVMKAGSQGMFHFMSLSAPFVIGPANSKLYWFDPQTMKPLLESPGHVRALEVLVELVQFGPKEMLAWDLGKGWDHFLAGRAALTFTWGDLGALAPQEGSYYHILPPGGSARIETYLQAGWDTADIRDYSRAYSDNFSNPLQFPYLRIPGAFAYWQALDRHLAEAVAGQLSAAAALKATAVDFEEITIRLGRERQRRAYRVSLGL